MKKRVLTKVGMEKEILRKELLLKRRSQRQEEILKKSRDIQKRLFSIEEFKEAESVMFYLAKKDEVRTEEMINKAFEIGKKVIVPSLRLNESGLFQHCKHRISPSLLLDPFRNSFLTGHDYESELEEGMFGILEPKAECIRVFPIEEIDIVLVPGIAFDETGGRIGFGGGFYDEFLAKLPSETKRWALAFEFQIVEKLPLTDKDEPVERIITEKRLIN